MSGRLTKWAIHDDRFVWDAAAHLIDFYRY